MQGFWLVHVSVSTDWGIAGQPLPLQSLVLVRVPVPQVGLQEDQGVQGVQEGPGNHNYYNDTMLQLTSEAKLYFYIF